MNSQASQANFPVVLSEKTVSIQLPNRLSVLEAVAFKQTCRQLLEQHPAIEQVVLNFHRTQFIDSSGVGVLVHLYKTAQEQGVRLNLEEVCDPVMAVLAMTGLDKIFSISSRLRLTHQPHRWQASQPPETHPSVCSWIKRLIDIVGSLVGLSITALLFIPIAIAIKQDSPGPIFFGQTRCGWLGKRFRIWKFRSMCVNAEAMKSLVVNEASGAIFKNDNDPRITRVGRFLRRTSLDELPQFWNVLRGEMSLVGTRPPTPDEVERYEVPAWQRLDVKPGMTGEWQVSGRSQVRDFEEVIELDLRYQHHWSLQYDLQLIFKTLLLLFNRNSGAV